MGLSGAGRVRGATMITLCGSRSHWSHWRCFTCVMVMWAQVEGVVVGFDGCIGVQRQDQVLQICPMQDLHLVQGPWLWLWICTWLPRACHLPEPVAMPLHCTAHLGRLLLLVLVHVLVL